jgi:hypothetical protein
VTGDAVRAEGRDTFEAWTIERVQELRRLYDRGVDDSDPAAIALQTELEQAAVEWKTFLVKTVDAHKSPKMAILNYTWYQWRQAADLQRDLRVLTGRKEQAANRATNVGRPSGSRRSRTIRSAQSSSRPTTPTQATLST